MTLWFDRRQTRLPIVALVALAALALPTPTPAQSSYVPPKLLKQGAPTSSIAGVGTVIVKVLVNADGSFKVQGVIKSTNHADDNPALEIAKTSKYKPAQRNGSPVLAFYDFSLKFTGKSVSSEESSTSGDVAKYDAMVRAGNYSGAKSGLTEYLAAHPGDQQAALLLGAADVGLKDYEGATKAFDSAGTASGKYQRVAAVAYAQYAAERTKANDAAAAVSAAKKAAQYAPSAPTYNLLGTAELAAHDTQAAVADLEKAASLAANDPKQTPKDRAVIQGNLATAYAQAGQMDKAKAAAAQASKLDPSSAAGQTVLASSYLQKAEEFEKGGKLTDAAAQYEAAAAAAPAEAVTLYTRAAFAYLNVKPSPESAKAKAAADKALAINGNDARANFAAGVALADEGKAKDALPYLNKADAAAKAANDTQLTASIEAAIKQLGGAK